MASIIPEVLNHFNIYNGANALVGVSGEVELNFRSLRQSRTPWKAPECSARSRIR